MNVANQEMLDKVDLYKCTETTIFDLDSNNLVTYADQKRINLSTLYGTVVFYTVVVFDNVPEGVLKA